MMKRMPIAHSIAFSSVLVFAAASGVAWAADSSQQQSTAYSTPSEQTTQQSASSGTASGADSSTSSSAQPATSGGGQMDQSAAASPSPGSDTSSTTTTTTTTDSGQTASTTTGQGSANVAPVMNEEQLTELEGKTVVNTQGEEIGKVDSIVRDRSDQSLKAVIKSGGFFGIGGEKVAVAADDLKLQGDDKVQLNTPMTKEELQQTASAYNAENYEPIGGSQQAAGSQPGQPADSSTMGRQRG